MATTRIDPSLQKEIEKLRKQLQTQKQQPISFREATHEFTKHYKKTKDEHKQLRYLLTRKPRRRIKVKTDLFELEGKT